MTHIPVYFCLQICICAMLLSMLMFRPAGPAAPENQIRNEMKDQKISSSISMPGCHMSRSQRHFMCYSYCQNWLYSDIRRKDQLRAAWETEDYCKCNHITFCCLSLFSHFFYSSIKRSLLMGRPIWRIARSAMALVTRLICQRFVLIGRSANPRGLAHATIPACPAPQTAGLKTAHWPNINQLNVIASGTSKEKRY